MRVRQYSISSSPLTNTEASPNTCTITYGVIARPSLSSPSTPFVGVAGHYLHSLKPGDNIQISVRPTAKKTFRLPASPATTPLLMFCAGTGLAPFRGFVQQRAIQLTANPSRPLAPAVLFVGCRSATRDRLYAAELDAWEAMGAVRVKYAFSGEGGGHVGDLMVRERALVEDMWHQGARVYVCGMREFAKGVAEGARRVVGEIRKERGMEGEKEDLEDWFRDVVQERVASDVFD